DTENSRAAIKLTFDDGAQWHAWLADTEHMRPWLWKHILAGSTRAEQFARAARGWVQDQVNESLQSRANSEATVSARVLFDGSEERFSLHIVPATLLAAMWFQCARLLT